MTGSKDYAGAWVATHRRSRLQDGEDTLDGIRNIKAIAKRALVLNAGTDGAMKLPIRGRGGATIQLRPCEFGRHKLVAHTAGEHLPLPFVT